MTLLTRARKLAGPDRAIDAEIFWYAGYAWRPTLEKWLAEFRTELSAQIAVPTYTHSLDAIVGLIEAKLPGWKWDVTCYRPHQGRAYRSGLWTEAPYRQYYQYGTTPVLALVCAFLAALESTSHD